MLDAEPPFGGIGALALARPGPATAVRENPPRYRLFVFRTHRRRALRPLPLW